ncbi:MAG: hypothetical protein JWO67_1715 [Streptosporangiaceae bacterium]|nr:hypothetical protein [Streptosporangiaceae bacterium]
MCANRMGSNGKRNFYGLPTAEARHYDSVNLDPYSSEDSHTLALAL